MEQLVQLWHIALSILKRRPPVFGNSILVYPLEPRSLFKETLSSEGMTKTVTLVS